MTNKPPSPDSQAGAEQLGAARQGQQEATSQGQLSADQPGQQGAASQTQPGTSPQGQLSAQGVQLGYGAQPIVKGVSLTPPPAQLTVLAGPNGCGKSTLLRGLARLLKPSQGQVILNGADIASRPARAVAKELGLLPQGPQAPAGLTVRELVARGRYPHRSMLRSWSREDEQALTQALADTHTTELAHRQVDSLSGGQRQRVWIAMVLAQRTGVLLLDEPTTYLDLTHQIEVLDLLRELNRRHQTTITTIVVVLHELALAARYADYLVFMRAGQILAAGEPAQVVTTQNLAAAFELEARVVPDPVSGTPLVVPVRSLRGQK